MKVVAAIVLTGLVFFAAQAVASTNDKSGVNDLGIRISVAGKHLKVSYTDKATAKTRRQLRGTLGVVYCGQINADTKEITHVVFTKFRWPTDKSALIFKSRGPAKRFKQSDFCGLEKRSGSDIGDVVMFAGPI